MRTLTLGAHAHESYCSESEKQAIYSITRERKRFNEICILITFGVQRKLRW